MKKAAFIPILAAMATVVPAASFAEAASDSTMSRYGRIVDKTTVPGTSLTAWLMEKNGSQVVLYGTSDGKAIFTGVVWNPETGQNLSDGVRAKLKVSAPVAPVAAKAAPSAGIQRINDHAIKPGFKGVVPESIKTVAGLKGVTQGKGSMGETLYVMVDPRCGYSQLAYKQLKPYIDAGKTVKWIPIPALADREAGGEMVAAIHQDSNQSSMLDRQMTSQNKARVKPSASTKADMERALSFFYAAFEHNGSQQAGVPVGFFFDQRTNSPRMLMGLSEPAVVQDIFGALK